MSHSVNVSSANRGFRPTFLFTLLLILSPALDVSADEKGAADPFQKTLPKTYRLRVSLRLDATAGNLRGVHATMPVPVNWREQSVKLLKEANPQGCVCRIQKIAGKGAILHVRIARLSKGKSVVVERIYELTRHRIRFQRKTTGLIVPPRPNSKLAEHLLAAPGIEIGNKELRRQAKTLWIEKDAPWENVRRIYDWVRKRVRYRLMSYRGAVFAMKNRTGDCEDMSALFIALCRCCKVPARSVWIEGHAYAEFYLEDKTGQGFWIPAQLAGLPEFGKITEYRPILQKCDRVRDPIRKRRVRYLPQSARAIGGVPGLRVKRTILRMK